MAKEVNPRLVFERLFGNAADGERRDRAKRDRYQQSILDFVAEDAGRLQAQARRAPTAASSTST